MRRDEHLKNGPVWKNRGRDTYLTKCWVLSEVQAGNLPIMFSWGPQGHPLVPLPHSSLWVAKYLIEHFLFVRNSQGGPCFVSRHMPSIMLIDMVLYFLSDSLAPAGKVGTVHCAPNSSLIPEDGLTWLSLVLCFAVSASLQDSWGPLLYWSPFWSLYSGSDSLGSPLLHLFTVTKNLPPSGCQLYIFNQTAGRFYVLPFKSHQQNWKRRL